MRQNRGAKLRNFASFFSFAVPIVSVVFLTNLTKISDGAGKSTEEQLEFQDKALIYVIGHDKIQRFVI